jgi:hypothetical protein
MGCKNKCAGVFEHGGAAPVLPVREHGARDKPAEPSKRITAANECRNALHPGAH